MDGDLNSSASPSGPLAPSAQTPLTLNSKPVEALPIAEVSPGITLSRGTTLFSTSRRYPPSSTHSATYGRSRAQPMTNHQHRPTWSVAQFLQVQSQRSETSLVSADHSARSYLSTDTRTYSLTHNREPSNSSDYISRGEWDDDDDDDEDGQSLSGAGGVSLSGATSTTDSLAMFTKIDMQIDTDIACTSDDYELTDLTLRPCDLEKTFNVRAFLLLYIASVTGVGGVEGGGVISKPVRKLSRVLDRSSMIERRSTALHRPTLGMGLGA